MKKLNKITSRSVKLFALVMTLVLLMSSMPLTLQAMAIETDVNIEEVEEYREEYSKHFKMPDGTYKAVSYTAPVHRMDENGEWQDLENILSESTVKNKQAYVTSDGRTIFSKKISADDRSVFEINDGGYSMKVSFDNEEIKNSNAKLSNHAKKYQPTNTDDIETQYKKLKEIDTNTTVKYKNIIKNIDLEYVLSANDIKENIIIRKACDDYEFSFIYEFEGLSATLCEDGSVEIYDSETNEVKYNIPAPYMYDDDGVESTDVTYSLEDLGEGRYRLTVTPDKAWINAEDRAFPVIVDPTVALHANVWDTFIDKNRPTETFGSAEDLWISQNHIVFMKSSTMLPTLPENSKVTEAILNVRYYYNISSGSLSVGLHPVTFSWGTSSLTWNSASQHTNMGMESDRASSAAAFAASNITSDSPGNMYFDVTKLVRRWYAGDYMYGIALKYITGTNTSVIIKSTECGTETRAYCDITYAMYTPDFLEGVYHIENVGTGRYIDVEGPSTSYGAVIQQWDFHTGSSEQWVLDNLEGVENCVRLKSTLSNLFLGVDPDNPSLIKQYPEHRLNTAWKLEQTYDGNYKLVSQAAISGGKVLAVPLNANSNGTDLTQISYSDDFNYRDEWRLVSQYITLPLRIFYDETLEAKQSDIIDYLDEALAYIREEFLVDFQIESIQMSTLLNLDPSCTGTINEECNRDCGLLSTCSTTHHRSAVRLLNLLQSDSIYTCRVVKYAICLYENGEHWKPNGACLNATLMDTVVTFRQSIEMPQTFIHELSHCLGANDGCNVEDCVMYYEADVDVRTWCTSCRNDIREYIDNLIE